MSKGRDPSCDTPPSHNPDGGRGAIFCRGGKMRKDGGKTEGTKSARRLDRPGRARGGKLTAAARQALPKADFALPGKGAGPKGAGSGSYPIPDENHAKAALSRASANASPAQQATIRAKVHAKFPGIGQKD